MNKETITNNGISAIRVSQQFLLEKGPSASLLVRHLSQRIRSSLAPSIQTLLKPTVCLSLMRRCTRGVSPALNSDGALPCTAPRRQLTTDNRQLPTGVWTLRELFRAPGKAGRLTYCCGRTGTVSLPKRGWKPMRRYGLIAMENGTRPAGKGDPATGVKAPFLPMR
jgi:hypothetical protein